MNVDPSTTKYLIRAKITAEGIVEKPDVVGAIFGQTEGLLGDELDLRDLQKSGRMGRIEVEVESKKGKSEGEIIIPSSLDQVETAILASALETIDRVGPCKAQINIKEIEDVRIVKRNKVVERAKELLAMLMEQAKSAGSDLTESVRQAVQVEEIVDYGPEKCPAGPNVATSDAIIIVEGRSDVLNLLKYGIKNAIAVEGTNVPKSIQELSKERSVTAFVDGDRGGDLILRELLQVAEVDFIARAPRGKEVEELTQKQIIKALRNKMPSEQFIEVYGVEGLKNAEKPKEIQFFEEKEAKEAQPPKTEVTQEIKKTVSADKVRIKEKKLSPEQRIYKEKLKTLSGTLKANLISPDGKVIKETAVRELADTLQNAPSNVNAVVFDGVVTQRILDLASSANIKTVVGVKAGNITKQPASVEIYTKSDLE